jgi:hypothetical protein
LKCFDCSGCEAATIVAIARPGSIHKGLQRSRGLPIAVYPSATC